MKLRNVTVTIDRPWWLLDIRRWMFAGLAVLYVLAAVADLLDTRWRDGIASLFIAWMAASLWWWQQYAEGRKTTVEVQP